MTMPTAKQHDLLLMLGNGCALVIGRRRQVAPLLRRGWVTARDDGDHFSWVRITPDGLRALALSVEKYGLPEIGKRTA